jgi:protein-disulfide isomerase
MFTNSFRTLSVLGMLASLSLVGCHGPRKADSSAAGEDSSGKVSAGDTATSGAAAAGGSTCDQLAEKLCGEAGKESQTCTAGKSTLALLSDAACATALKDFAGTQAKLASQGENCTKLVEKLCSGVGPETESCKMVTAKTKEFPPEQCTQMLGHVDEIIADLKKQEQSNQPLDDTQQAAIAASDAPSFGPADAKVTVVEFSDFECPYCSRAANITSQVKEKYGAQVRVVFRQFPLSFHQNAQGAAEASLAAHSQGKFWEFHDKMFENQRALDRPSLEGYAQELGLDMVKFKAALDAKEHEARVKGDLEMGNTVAVQGTPTMFVNGKRIANPTDFGAVSQAIDAALGS